MATRTLLPSLFQQKEVDLETSKVSNPPQVPSDLPRCLQRTYLASTRKDALYCYSLGIPHVYVGTCAGAAHKYNVFTGDELVVFRGHADIIRQMEVTLDKEGTEQLLYTVSRDKTLRGYDVVTGRQVFPTATAHAPLECLTTSSSNVFAGAVDGVVHVFKQGSAEQVGSLRIHSCNVKDMIAEGDMLYTCSLDSLVKCVDISTMALASIFEGMSPLRCLAMTSFARTGGAEEELLFAGASSGDLLVYDRRTTRCVHSLKGHKDAILCITAKEYKVWTGSDDRTVKQWDLRSPACEYTYLGSAEGIKALRADTADHTVAVGSLDRSVYIWEIMDPRKHCRAGSSAAVSDFTNVVGTHLRKYAKHTDTEGNKVLSPAMWKESLNAVDCTNLKVIDAIFMYYEQSKVEEVDVAEITTNLAVSFVKLHDAILRQMFGQLNGEGNGDLTVQEVEAVIDKGEAAWTKMGLTKTIVKEAQQQVKAGPLDYEAFRDIVLRQPRLTLALLGPLLTSMAANIGANTGPLTPEEEQALLKKYEGATKSSKKAGGKKK